MVTFDMTNVWQRSHKIALSLSATFLGHSLQGNIGSSCLLMLLLLFLEFILISLKWKKSRKKY